MAYKLALLRVRELIHFQNEASLFMQYSGLELRVQECALLNSTVSTEISLVLLVSRNSFVGWKFVYFSCFDLGAFGEPNIEPLLPLICKIQPYMCEVFQTYFRYSKRRFRNIHFSRVLSQKNCGLYGRKYFFFRNFPPYCIFNVFLVSIGKLIASNLVRI